MTMTPVIRTIPHGSVEYDQAIILRRAVLRTPLGLDFSAEQLAAEATDIHICAFDDEALTGTVVITPYSQTTAKLRQMAVAPGKQGTGLGAQILASAESHVRALGLSQIALAARVTAQAFYEKNGYKPEGETFIEVTIPHILMTKAL
jgi:predicted GNAT family N-acyltransferase